MKSGMQFAYKKLNWKFLVSYIIVFLVPFLILSGILTWLIVSRTKVKIETTNNEGLTQVCMSLDQHFEKLNNISLDMSLNSGIGKRVTMNPIEAMTFEQELQRYVFFSDIAEDIYIAYNDEEMLYSNVGTMELDTLISQRLKNHHIDQQVFKQNLFSEEPKLVSFEEKPKMLFYFVPFTVSGVKIGKIIYAIPVTSLVNRVIKPFQKADQDYSVYLGGKEVSSTLSGTAAEGIDLTSYFTQSMDLSNVDLTLQSLVSESVLNREIIKVMMIVIGCLLILLLVGIGVVVYYGYHQYEPVYRLHRLYRYVAKYNDADSSEIHFDELGDFLFQQSMRIDSSKKEIQHIRDEAFWKQILKGDFTKLPAIKKEAKRISKQFTFEESYFLGIISADFFDEAKTDVQMKSLLMNLFPYSNLSYQVECIEMTYLNQFIFIFQLNEQSSSSERLLQLKTDFTQFLNKELNSELRITFSKQATTIDKLHLTYISVMAQKESNQQPQPSNAGQWEAFSYPNQAVMTLKQAIKVGNPQAIEKIVKDIVANEQAMEISFFLRQSYYHYVLQQLLSMSAEAKIIPSLSDRDANIVLSQIEDELKQLALELADDFAKEIAAHEKEIDQEILQMIHENFTRSSFSLEEMAIKFGVSLSKMSIMVKNEANVSFSKYVQTLRIERVKQELLETSKPVKEIIMDVGYHDIANFTRKFREEVGVPPGQFRKIFETIDKPREAQS